MIDAAGQSDAGAFLVRLLRLDPAAVVRLRPVRRGQLPGTGPADLSTPGDPTSLDTVSAPEDLSEIWAMLPFGVLVVRVLRARQDGDVTVSAAELLKSLGDAGAPPPRRRDEAWRWPLPPHRGQPIEQVPAEAVAQVAEAASRTLSEASQHGVAGRAVGERVIRDALLDHIPIVVTGYDGVKVNVPQRLVQAVMRMGFVSYTSAHPSKSVTFGDNLVTVRLAVGWIGLDASYGCAWYRPSSPMRMS